MRFCAEVKDCTSPKIASPPSSRLHPSTIGARLPGALRSIASPICVCTLSSAGTGARNVEWGELVWKNAR